jgi:predicted porin
MKKSLLALAALSAFATAAQAQSSVTVYGAVGASSNSISTNGVDSPSAFQDQDKDFLGTTNLGFKGSEDLGGGNKAFFQLEGDLSMSGVLGAAPGVPSIDGAQDAELNTANATNPGHNIFNRQAHVGISTKSYGTFSFGRQNDSVKDTEGLRQVYNLSDNTTNNTVVGDRIANSYKYATPVFNGLSATYTYSNNPTNADQTAADGTTTHNSYAINYKVPFNGGIDLAYAYGSQKTHSSNKEIETTMMSARTVIMGVTVGAGYAINEDQAGDELKQTLVSASKAFGAFEVKAHYVKNKQTGDLVGDNRGAAISGSTKTVAETDNTVAGDGYGLMGVYNLSKRTAAYVGYADFSADNSTYAAKADIKTTTVGILHKF